MTLDRVGPGRTLEIDRISKRYGDVVALDNLSLEVPSGEVVGFVGRNGAGKTTTMRIVLGVLSAAELVICPRNVACTRGCTSRSSSPTLASCMA
jgi:ABC-type uncharacterized transport system ATPase subunit